MKTMIRLMAVAVGLMFAQMAMAQAAPAGSTGICRDGTYTTAPTKKGACKGHKGVKTWLAADNSAAPAKEAKESKSSKKAAEAAAPAPATAPAEASPAPAKSSSHPARADMAQAPGGGPGMVWVNTASNVYHCPGSKYYGKTKAGSYMSEADAKAKGAHPDHNHPCSK